MSTSSIPARRVLGLWDKVLHDETFTAEHGDFEILDDALGPKAIAVCCPGCGTVALLQLRPGNGPDWRFDGNRSEPTLYPSIHHLQCWHGWMRAGQFVSC